MSDVSRYGVNTYSYTFTHTALDTMKHLCDQGYRAFELMMFPGHLWPAHTPASERKDIARYLSSHNLRVTTLNQPNIDINIGAAVHEMREYSIGAIERIILLAADIGAQGVIIGPGKANPLLPASHDEMRSRFFSALDRFLLLGERLGVQVLLENMPVGFVADTTSLTKLLDDYGSDAIGVVYDVANAAFIGEDIGSAIAMLGPRFKYVHLSDTPAHTCKHDPINNGGIVPFKAVGATLAAMRHTEPPIIEIISQDPDREILSSIQTLWSLGWN
jgi:sugar phosphate isomerase/epimerase